MIDTIDLILKIVTLFLLAASSEMAFKRRTWGVMVLTLGLWLTVFRAAVLRSISLYVGVFNHTPQAVISTLQSLFMGGWLVVITDAVAVIGAFMTFAFIASAYKDEFDARQKKQRT